MKHTTTKEMVINGVNFEQRSLLLHQTPEEEARLFAECSEAAEKSGGWLPRQEPMEILIVSYGGDGFTDDLLRAFGARLGSRVLVTNTVELKDE